VAVNALTGEVRRLAHHRSRGIGQSYYYQPRISASWGGQYVEWPSNFNQSGLVDNYVVPFAASLTHPVLWSLTPSSVLPGLAGLVLTVNGADFSASSQVQWNGAPRATVFVSSTLLTATIPATDLLTSGTAQVTVVNPPPGGGTSNPLSFIVGPASSLAVVRMGNGSGTVTSTPGGITCGTRCAATFLSLTPVGLLAAPAPNSTFTGWTGCDSAQGTQCAVLLASSKTVTATFQAAPVRLTIAKAGTGSGAVTGSSAIACGTVCSQVLPAGSVLTLTATADPGSTFAGWSGGGGCGGTGACGVTLTADTTVTATFQAPAGQVALAVGLRGSASGAVTSDLGAISCGASCAALYSSGTTVTLTASPGPGALFKGWVGGGCTGTVPCLVSMTAMRSVAAVFSPAFTDPSPTSATSPIRAVDITELRQAINTLRAQNFGLAPFPFTDAGLGPGSLVQAVHLEDLRAALVDPYAEAGLSLPLYTDPVLSPGVTIVKAVHLGEVRGALGALE
jgi:hypothetical protein